MARGEWRDHNGKAGINSLRGTEQRARRCREIRVEYAGGLMKDERVSFI